MTVPMPMIFPIEGATRVAVRVIILTKHANRETMRVRTGVLSQMLIEAEALGVDIDAEMAAVGLTRTQIDGLNQRLPLEPCAMLWERLVIRSGDPHLSLRAADAVPFGAFDVIDQLGARLATVGGVLAMLARYFRIINSTIQPRLSAHPEGWCFDAPGAPNRAAEILFTVTLNRLHRLLGERLRPLRVELMRGPIAPASVARTIFGSGLCFHQTQDALIFDQAAFDRALPTPDPGLKAILERHAQSLMASLDPTDDFITRIEREIDAGLSTHAADLNAVARRIGMSGRTLQRRLGQLSPPVSFNTLLNRRRRARAETHLRAGRLSVPEVAFLLGYSDATAFQRAFKRWTGMPIRRWRGAQG
jgi:AraC-like DNA-binding protein